MFDELKGGAKPKGKPEKETSPSTLTVKSVSRYDPNEPVMSTAPMSLRMNRYQHDIAAKGAKKMKISKQAFIRHAILEYAMSDCGIM